MLQEKAFVSIIIPNYNHASYLDRRIETVLNQSFRNFEVIILDDFSIDNSKEVIEKYRKHPQVTHIILNEVNSGSPLIQWQKGLELATGEYIWIAESDDYADLEFLNVQINLLKSRPAALCYCDSVFVDENEKHGERISSRLNYLFHTNKWNNAYYAKGIDELQTCLIDACTILNVSSVVFKKGILMEYLGKVVSFKSTGDWLLYMLVCIEHDIIYTNLALNYFRIHATNTTKTAAKNGKSSFERYYSRRKVYVELSKKKPFLPVANIKSLQSKLLNKMFMELKFILSLCLKGKAPFSGLYKAASSFVLVKSKVH